MVTPPPIQLASISMADSVILMILALVVFGPRKLPQIGRQIGKLMYEFRKASNDFKFQMEEELRLAEESDRRKKDEEERKRIAALAASSQTEEPKTEATSSEIAAVAEPSPYPGEEVYPPVSVPEPSGEPATVVLPRVGPVIQPPSTGETVSASKPGTAATEALTDASKAAESATDPHQSEDPHQTESITHNG